MNIVKIREKGYNKKYWVVLTQLWVKYGNISNPNVGLKM